MKVAKGKTGLVSREANNLCRHGVNINGAEIYTTASPCWNCFKMMANAGIQRIFYGEFYREQRSLEVAKTLGIELVPLMEGDPEENGQGKEGVSHEA